MPPRWPSLRTLRPWKQCCSHRPYSMTTPEKKKIVFSGIQPTGTPHLGNYLGALKNWVSLQNSFPPESDIFYCIVDMHAITVPYEPATLRAHTDEMWYVLHAVGIDMQRCTVFEQSAIPEHAELNWILGSLTTMGQLNRMTQWKAKLEQIQSKGLISRPEKEDDIFGGSRLGLFAYPVLQAADILLYNATHVPVGEDQSQHLETTRLIARTFNKTYATYAKTHEIKPLNIPETLISAYPRIASLTNPSKKMSKSANEKTIFLTSPPSEIETIISRALTDSLPGITASPERPGITNLLNICAAFKNISVEELEEKVRDWKVREFKEYVAQTIIIGLEPIQRRYAEVKGNKTWLEKVRREGNEKARRVAMHRMEVIKELVGLSPTRSIRGDRGETT